MSLFTAKDKKKIESTVKSLAETLKEIGKDKNSKSLDKLVEEAAKTLQLLKNQFTGDANDPNQADAIQAVSSELLAQDIPLLLISNMVKLDFESKKDAATILCAVLRKQVGNRNPGVDYFAKNPVILERLMEGYNNSEVSINSGTILRECIRHEALTAILLQSETFFKFFIFVEFPNFDVASDAFATFKEMLTKHKTMSAEFLEKNYDKLFEEYTRLLHSENYVTKRQSLKLLGELLLDRSNFNVMTKYISQQKNLKLMMNLLRDKSRSIQFEAFHVFKVFVANPNKPKPVLDILIKNKDKLLKFLKTFQSEREDEQFNDE